ncbi:hypothetical protein BX600DRAFT_453322 [Xylariales sp. PMI_506]|nr:hypothetical protein BX600DRAFT_453322 [Xylariales sp. PMI_506]
MMPSNQQGAVVSSHSQPPSELLNLLESHIPFSLPLLRRLQFARRPGCTTEHARTLWTVGGNSRDTAFTAAYVDLSRAPETQVWMYSSLEAIAAGADAEAERKAREQALALLEEVRRMQSGGPGGGGGGGANTVGVGRVLVGSLSETVRRTLVSRYSVFVTHSAWDKWMFRAEHLPAAAALGAGLRARMETQRLRWGPVRTEDLGLVLQRTAIKRTEETMSTLPSTAIVREDGIPVAWCFLGPDGSLCSLYCEEQYRGQGFAKAVAIKLMQDHLQDFGGDGFGVADVAPNNVKSQSVCRSLGGQIMWSICWTTIDLEMLPSSN